MSSSSSSDGIPPALKGQHNMKKLEKRSTFGKVLHAVGVTTSTSARMRLYTDSNARDAGHLRKQAHKLNKWSTYHNENVRRRGSNSRVRVLCGSASGPLPLWRSASGFFAHYGRLCHI